MSYEMLTLLNKDDLKVGDTVGFCRYPTYGWNRQFRYPIVSEKVIERITPKRTKFVLSGGVELDKYEADRLVEVNEEAKRQTEIAKTFSDLQTINYKFSQATQRGDYVIERSLDDEELLEYHKVLKHIYDKYLGGE